jgi:hypothetical protein
MVEAGETLRPPTTLLEHFLQLVKRIEAKDVKKKLAEDEVRKRALKELKNTSSTPTKDDVEVKKASNFSKGLEDNNQTIQNVARAGVRQEAYKSNDIAEKVDFFKKVKGEIKLPFEASVDAVDKNPALASFHVNVALASETLQKNPDFIKHEVARLYYSTDWTSLDNDGFTQTRQTIQNALSYAQSNDATHQPINQDAYYALIDKRPNIARTVRPEQSSDYVEPGHPPLKNKGNPENHEYMLDANNPEYETWQKNTYKKYQHKAIHEYLRDAQNDLDRLEGNPHKQEDYLNNVFNELTKGKQKDPLKVQIYGKTPNGENYDLTITIDKRFNTEQANRHMDIVEKPLKELHQANVERLEAERNIRQQASRNETELQQAIERGDYIIWTQELADKFGTHTDKIGQALKLPSRGRLQPEDIFAFRDAKDSESAFDLMTDWMTKFKKDNMTENNPWQLDLPEQMELHDFQEVVKFFMGEDNLRYKFMREYTGTFKGMDDFLKFMIANPGAKIENVMEAMKRMQSASNKEILLQVDEIRTARPAFSEAMVDVVAKGMQDVQAAHNELAQEKDAFNPTGDKRALNLTKPQWKEFLEKYYKDIHHQNETKPISERIPIHEMMLDKIHPYINLSDADFNALNEMTFTKNELAELYRYRDTYYHDLKPLQIQEMLHLNFLVDIVGNGGALREKDFNVNFTAQNRVVRYQEQYLGMRDELKKLLALEKPNQTQLQEYVGKINNRRYEYGQSILGYELEQVKGITTKEKLVDIYKETMKNHADRFNQEWHDYAGKYLQNTLRIDDTVQLKELSNLSPIAMVAREKFNIAKRAELTRLGAKSAEIEQWFRKNNLKIEEAIWASRNLSLLSGEPMEVAATLVQSASLDLKFILGRPNDPKYFMERTAFEQWTRIFNHHLFDDDFNMGGEMGAAERNILYKIIFREAGFDYNNVTNNEFTFKPDSRLTPEQNRINRDIEVSNWNKWIKRRDLMIKNKAPEWVLIAEYSKNILGLSESEIIRPEELAVGLGLGSTWRLKREYVDALDKIFMKMKQKNLPKKDARYDLQGVGYRYHAAQTDAEKLSLLNTIIERKISVPINLIGEDLAKIVAAEGRGINIFNSKGEMTLEWKTFLNTISTMEMETWKDAKLKFVKFDMGNTSDALDLMKRSYYAATGTQMKQPVIDSYFTVIRSVQDYLRLGKGLNGEVRINNWMNHKFSNKFILTRSDFDPASADITALNTFSNNRRLNDAANQIKARDIIQDIMYGHPELYLFPKNGKEVDAVAKDLELIRTISNYNSTDDAEVVGSYIAELRAEWNWNQASHTVAGWIPGAVSLMKNMGVIHEGATEVSRIYLNFMKLFPGGKDYAKKYLEAREIDEWPLSVMGQVSHAVRFLGPESNAHDEFRTGGFFATAETMGCFTTAKGRKRLEHLKHTYHSGIFGRGTATLRKSWWAVPTATMAMGLSKTLDEEKKRAEGH